MAESGPSRLTAIGGTLSTGGNCAQGDLTGVGAEGFETRDGFSDGVLRTSPPVFGCAADRGFNTVAFGPTVVVDFCNRVFAFSSASWRCLASSAAACSAASMAALFAVRSIFVPSFHSIASGAQSSSSSSISAHFASFPSPSACKRVARCMPYCCLSSSSVKCFCVGWGAAGLVSTSGQGSLGHVTSISIPDLHRIWARRAILRTEGCFVWTSTRHSTRCFCDESWSGCWRYSGTRGRDTFNLGGQQLK